MGELSDFRGMGSQGVRGHELGQVPVEQEWIEREENGCKVGRSGAAEGEWRGRVEWNGVEWSGSGAKPLSVEYEARRGEAGRR
jgi:hypothetical protein